MEAASNETSFATFSPRHFVTNVMQFKGLSGSDYLAGCDFHLTGIITLVDTNRDLVVLQDATGSVALHFPMANQPLEATRVVTLTGINCQPLFLSFPNYPHHPSGEEICSAFEVPANWGAYNLTRIRGYLRPPITGEYRFWIASDDSSELWLSTDSSPANVRKIATVPRFAWTDPHQWSKFPAQHSELIQLQAGEAYYIEAFQEQTIAGEHLSVAWQTPATSNQDCEVIDGRHLSPWLELRNPTNAPQNGILRQYWTNFSNGNIEGLAGPRPYKSALTVKEMTVTEHGPVELPKPEEIDWNQLLAAGRNYQWVSASGLVKFKAVEGGTASLEIYDGKSLIPVRALHWSADLSRQLQQLTNPIAQVQGVCEGVEKPDGKTVPELVWASSSNSILLFESGPTNSYSTVESQNALATANGTSTTLGYFGTRGVVTFSDQIFGKDFIFIQEANSAWRIAPEASELKHQLRYGHFVDIGGSLSSDGSLQTITPLFVVDLGLHSMPSPVINPEIPSKPANLEGKWIELEGVGRRTNTDGTLTIAGEFGTISIWISRTEAARLAGLVDARLRVRGVLTLTLQDTPLLLVPSWRVVDVVKEPPPDPFAKPEVSIASIFAHDAGTLLHRMHVAGCVTYLGPNSFFIQDASGGGIRVRTPVQPSVKVGDSIAVSAFVSLDVQADTLIEPIIRPVVSLTNLVPKDLDLTEALPSNQRGSLVQVYATLLTQKTNGTGCVLELQAQQRVFTAALALGQGNLPNMLTGSRLRVSGVCDDDTASEPQERTPRAQFLSSLKILLRSPEDVKVLSGPPWWTWQRTAILVGVLLTVLAVALLWVHLLQRRLERQKAARLAFSKLVLERLEDERRRIAVNLHDSLGQTLLVVKNHAALALQSLPGQGGLKGRLDEISGATTQAIEEVRRITRGLRPYQLDRLGLTQAIRASVSHASENGTIVFASLVEDIDNLFNKDAEIHVYRIVQEAITNVLKHSGATEAAVVIKQRDSVVSLSVRDNGCGFDMAKSPDQLHDLGYGLTGIAERARILEGTLSIETQPGSGTNLTVEVPIPDPSS